MVEDGPGWGHLCHSDTFLVSWKLANFRVHTLQGNLFVFKVRELSGNFVMCKGKMKFCRNVNEMSGNFTFQPDEAGMFGPDIFFLLNS